MEAVDAGAGRGELGEQALVGGPVGQGGQGGVEPGEDPQALAGAQPQVGGGAQPGGAVGGVEQDDVGVPDRGGDPGAPAGGGVRREVGRGHRDHDHRAALRRARGDGRAADREVRALEVDVVQLVAVDEPPGGGVADLRVVLPAVPEPGGDLHGVGRLGPQLVLGGDRVAAEGPRLGLGRGDADQPAGPALAHPVQGVDRDRGVEGLGVGGGDGRYEPDPAGQRGGPGEGGERVGAARLGGEGVVEGDEVQGGPLGEAGEGGVVPGVEAAEAVRAFGAVEGGGQVQLAGHGEPDFPRADACAHRRTRTGVRVRAGTRMRGDGPRAEPGRAGGEDRRRRDVSRAAVGERSAQPRHAADHTRPKSMWLRVTSGHEAFTASVDQGFRRFVNRRSRPSGRRGTRKAPLRRWGSSGGAGPSNGSDAGVRPW